MIPPLVWHHLGGNKHTEHTAALFINSAWSVSSLSCYLYPIGIDMICHSDFAMLSRFRAFPTLKTRFCLCSLISRWMLPCVNLCVRSHNARHGAAEPLHLCMLICARWAKLSGGGRETCQAGSDYADSVESVGPNLAQKRHVRRWSHQA